MVIDEEYFIMEKRLEAVENFLRDRDSIFSGDDGHRIGSDYQL